MRPIRRPLGGWANFSAADFVSLMRACTGVSRARSRSFSRRQLELHVTGGIVRPRRAARQAEHEARTAERARNRCDSPSEELRVSAHEIQTESAAAWFRAGCE